MTHLSRSSGQETRTLFPLKPEFRIVELGEADARARTDHLRDLEALIRASESMYPKIESWLTKKVVPGLRSSERIAYVAYESGKAIASAVLKLGDRSKFCHLRIHEDFQDQDLGQMLFTQMALQIRHRAKEVYFTLPESLWCSRRGFFEMFGFRYPARAPRQYRHGDQELLCSAPLATVWEAVVDKLPSLAAKFSVGAYAMDNRVLISIKPKYVEQLFVGAKLVEVRRRFSKKWLGCRAVLYASQPLGALAGEATISSIVSGQPAEIWSRYGAGIGSSRAEFDGYVSSAPEVFAIELADVTPYRSPVFLQQVSYLLQEDLKPPQSYCGLGIRTNASWAKAVSIASLLHGHLRHFDWKQAPATR